MIVGPLVQPARAGRWRPVPAVATIVRVVGVLCCLGSIAGAMAWFSVLSPARFSRWHSIDTLRNITIDEPGRYVVFEEGAGAADRVGPPPIAISVRSAGGKLVPTQSAIDGAGRSDVTYRIPFVEGRSLVSFDIDRAGKYVVLTYPLDERAGGGSSGRPSDPSLPDLAAMPPLALAREGEPSTYGSMAGLAVVAGIPALVGFALLAAAAVLWPSPLRGSTSRRARRQRDGRPTEASH